MNEINFFSFLPINYPIGSNIKFKTIDNIEVDGIVFAYQRDQILVKKPNSSLMWQFGKNEIHMIY